MCFKQTANLLSLGTHVTQADTSPRHACLGEVSRKIWLHDFAINNNGGSVPVIFISLACLEENGHGVDKVQLCIIYCLIQTFLVLDSFAMASVKICRFKSFAVGKNIHIFFFYPKHVTKFVFSRIYVF